MLVENTVAGFLEETASKNPVPGGGSIAASSGATAAALVEMVANLTIGKKKYMDVTEEMEQIREKAKAYREKLVKAVDEDADAFHQVMNAFKLPKETDEEKKHRGQEIQESMIHAAEVPLQVARDGLAIMELSRVVVEKGNSNAVTDGAVSAMMARTAVLSAIYNVRINLSSIKDQILVDKMSVEVASMETRAREMEQEILGLVEL